MQYRLHPANTIKEQHDKVRLEWAAVTAFFLNGLWKRGGGPLDWKRLEAFERVLEKHKLTHAVHLFQSYFAAEPRRTLEHAGFHEDQEFTAFVSGYI